MNNNNLAIRFTEETYSSRAMVAKALGTNLIDSIWLQIVSYRKTFKKDLKLINVYKIPYSICLTQSINIKNEELEKLLKRVNEEYKSFSENFFETEKLRHDMYKNELRYLAKRKNILINEIALENIISHRNTDLLYQPLVNYYEALNHLEENSNLDINDETVAKFLQILNGGGELTSFYRNVDFSSQNQKALINREYIGAPIKLIESMMESLYAFIKDDSLSILVRFAGISYAFDYIKPFEKYNDEIACLICKCLLNKIVDPSIVSIIPLENVFSENQNELINASKETQKNSDLTYYLCELNKIIENAITNFLDRTIQISREKTEHDYFSEESETKVTMDDAVHNENANETSKENEKEIIPETNIIKNEEKKTINKRPSQTYKSNNEPKVDVKTYVELDEKALKRAAQDLLESDPTLRPAQAHFYVRHCTIGRYYTIQQFKKAEGCVYETARTSMDNLARAGYYRREQVKNKFVYTPISK